MHFKGLIRKFLVLGVLLCAAAGAEAEAVRGKLAGAGSTLDAVLAAIDGEPVSLSDVRRFADSVGEKFNPRDDAALKATLRNYISLRLLEKEAEKSRLIVGSREVDEYMAKVIEQNKSTAAAFVQELRQQGFSLDQYRTQVRHEILRTRLIQGQLRKKVNVTEEDLERFLAEHPELRPADGTVRIEQISIANDDPFFNGDPAAIRAQLEKLRGEIRGGQDFARLGGVSYRDLGYVAPEDLLPELRAAIAELKVGDISSVIEGEQSASLIYFAGRADEKGSVIDERIRERIRGNLMNSKMKTKMREYFETELPKKYDVEMFLE